MVPAATAILDRLLAHAEIGRMQGKSYRLRNGKWEDEQKEACVVADRNHGQVALIGEGGSTESR